MRYKFSFTFIEVIIAVAIMAFALTAILAISGTSAAKIARAHQKWLIAHRTIQALEYFLLVGNSSGSLPYFIFPYSDNRVEFSILEPETLPNNTETVYMGWRLARCEVKLLDNYGKELSSVVVEKILREDDN